MKMVLVLFFLLLISITVFAEEAEEVVEQTPLERNLPLIILIVIAAAIAIVFILFRKRIFGELHKKKSSPLNQPYPQPVPQMQFQQAQSQYNPQPQYQVPQPIAPQPQPVFAKASPQPAPAFQFSEGIQRSLSKIKMEVEGKPLTEQKPYSQYRQPPAQYSPEPQILFQAPAKQQAYQPQPSQQYYAPPLQPQPQNQASQQQYSQPAYSQPQQGTGPNVSVMQHNLESALGSSNISLSNITPTSDGFEASAIINNQNVTVVFDKSGTPVGWK